jgi:hypothetical protein
MTRSISSQVPSVLPPSTKMTSRSEQNRGRRVIAASMFPRSLRQGMMTVVEASLAAARGCGRDTT